MNKHSLIEELLESGVDPNFQDRLGMTALMHSIEKVNVNAVNILSKQEINHEITDFSGKTIFDYSKLSRNLLIKKLIETSNFNNYTRFVNSVTSTESKDSDAFIYRLQELGGDVAIQRLLTASIGISAESGEFMEIVKKMMFQGKPCNEDNLEHLKIELGDIMWYVAQACMALDVDMNDVLDTNIKKLEKRYPDGHFSEFYSENRKKGDR